MFILTAMLCEGRLLSMTYDELEEVDHQSTQKAFHSTHRAAKASAMLNSTSRASLIHHSFSVQTEAANCTGASMELNISPLQSFNPQGVHTSRQTSSKIEIPAQAHSGGETPFLVPSFWESICKNYSDLHIGGEQVLPLSASDGELRVSNEAQAVGPFLQLCDVPSAVEDSLPEQTSKGGLLHRQRKGSNHWRQGSGRDRSFLFQGHEGPFSNSLLNHYLEQKLMDLYQQYMMENMVRERAPGSDSDAGIICPLLGSDLVLTSLDQITLQLSREGNLEAGLAKDMVLSCLKRVTSDLQSGEISTPFLQISDEASRDQLTDTKQEEP